MEKNFLGIDWGKRKIGVALAHAETKIAVPLGIFPNDETFFEKLGSILESENIGTCILGISKRRVEGEKGTGVKKFGEKLQEKFKILVITVDEMFTSKLAQEIRKKRGEKHVSENDDAEAAAILLQGWLDQQRNS